MAKNYTSKTALQFKLNKPRKIVLDRILAYSKSYSSSRVSRSALDLLKN